MILNTTCVNNIARSQTTLQCGQMSGWHTVVIIQQISLRHMKTDFKTITMKCIIVYQSNWHRNAQVS